MIVYIALLIFFMLYIYYIPFAPHQRDKILSYTDVRFGDLTVLSLAEWDVTPGYR